jgi:hypothetical protein
LASEGGSAGSYDMMGGFWITGDHDRAFSEIQYAVDSYFRSKECFRDECDHMFHGSIRSCYLEHQYLRSIHGPTTENWISPQQ